MSPKQTTERHSPHEIRSIEERVIDAMHRFSYTLVEPYAEPTSELLEIGFGEGYGSEIVRPWIGVYVGVEVDVDVVSHAAERYAHPNASFRLYDGLALPFADASFDIVISFQVLEHVDNAESFLRDARRVMRDDGVTLVVTPNRNHRVADGERPWNRYHVREYSPSELDEVMRSAFPEVEIVGIRGSDVMTRVERERVARARRLARLDRLGLRYRIPESLDNALRIARRKRARRVEANAEREVGVQHVRLRRGAEVETALDLLAIGRG